MFFVVLVPSLWMSTYGTHIHIHVCHILNIRGCLCFASPFHKKKEIQRKKNKTNPQPMAPYPSSSPLHSVRLFGLLFLFGCFWSSVFLRKAQAKQKNRFSINGTLFLSLSLPLPLPVPSSLSLPLYLAHARTHTHTLESERERGEAEREREKECAIN